MPMTIVSTRDAAPRIRGFLASCMLEIGPGLYLAPTMSAGVRERVWEVIHDWAESLGEGAIIMAWPDKSAPFGLALRTVGIPPYDLEQVDGMILVRREIR